MPISKFMALPEISLQYDLFTGQPVDNRTKTQKQQDTERVLPKQALLFSQRAIGQFGVNPNPLLPLSDTTRLTLISEDHRSPEDIERDCRREAEALTIPLFVSAQREISAPVLEDNVEEHPPAQAETRQMPMLCPSVSFIPLALAYNPHLAGLFLV